MSWIRAVKVGPMVIQFIAERRPYHWPHHALRFFVYSGSEPPALTIRVRSDPPMHRIEDTRLGELVDSWCLYAHRDGLRLEILHPVLLQPKQIALISADWKRIDLHVIPGMDNRKSKYLVWDIGEIMGILVPWWLAARMSIRSEGMILHSSALAWEGQGLVFVGPSGAGKSTIARWCRDHAGATVLNDERALLWHDGKRWQVSGTSWHGDLEQVSPLTVPLRRLFVLKQGPCNRFTPLPVPALLTHVLPESFMPLWSPDGMGGLMDAITRLLEEIPSGELMCVNDSSVVHYLKDILTDNEGIEISRGLETQSAV